MADQKEHGYYTDTEFITAGRAILGYYGYPGGYTPSGWQNALIGVWEKADYTNRQKLGSVYPEYWDAITIFMQDGGGGALQRAIEKRAS